MRLTDNQVKEINALLYNNAIAGHIDNFSGGFSLQYEHGARVSIYIDTDGYKAVVEISHSIGNDDTIIGAKETIKNLTKGIKIVKKIRKIINTS